MTAVISLTRCCPRCQWRGRPQTYDIGSGPEWTCPNCDHCFGALGQELKPMTFPGLEIPFPPSVGTAADQHITPGAHIQERCDGDGR